MLNFFLSLFGLNKPKMDNTLGDANLRLLAPALKGVNVKAAMNLLEATRDGKWEERYLYCNFIVENLKSLPTLPLLDECCKNEPNSATLYLIRGSAHLDAAWVARGNGDSSTVTTDGYSSFQSHLIKAEEDFRKVIALDPLDPSPWVYLISTGLGLGEDHEELLKRFEQATKLAPTHWYAHARLLHCLTEKWGGSHEDMFAFARKYGKGHLTGLIALAHVERWQYNFFLDNGDTKAAQYVQDFNARVEVEQAYEEFKKAIATKSATSIIAPKTIFCFWFYLVKDRQRLVPLAQELQFAMPESPWHYLDSDTAQPILEMQKFAGIVK